MKKLLLLQIIIALCNFKLNAMDPPRKPDIGETMQRAAGHFRINNQLIHECLNEVKDAQVHFFWTTGRTISENPDYKPMTDVQVGGSKYGQKFFPYLEGLLQNSPDKLKIIFVCDKMTVKSNEQQISSIQSIYGPRFECLPIEKVHKNLLKTFSSKQQEDKINVLFKNATQGSSVISSDVYRIIGMFYGQDDPQDNPSNFTGTLRTYCDIDAFCYGMESTRHPELIEALLRPVFNSPFYFGRSFTNNDIIKICITEIEPYKALCDRQLDQMDINKRVFPQYNSKSSISHFSDLHDMIKKCESDPIYCSTMTSLIPAPLYNIIQEVTQSTGPKFLSDKSITHDLSYPSETVGAWTAPEEGLDHRLHVNGPTHPPSVLAWGYGDSTPEEEKAFTKFTQDCDNYRKFLGVYFYAQRFGENHPFNIEIKKYLLNHYPYHRESFKELLRENFKFHNQDVKQDYELSFMECLPNKKSNYEKGNLYVEKKGDKLNFVAIPSDGERMNGTLDLNIEGDFTRIRDLRINKSEILQKASEIGLVLEPKRGLSFEEWQKSALNTMTIERKGGHYAVLTRLLKELGIEFPMTLESLNF